MRNIALFIIGGLMLAVGLFTSVGVAMGGAFIVAHAIVLPSADARTIGYGAATFVFVLSLLAT